MRLLFLWMCYVLAAILFAVVALFSGLKTGMIFAAPAAAAAGLWLMTAPLRGWVRLTRRELLAITSMANGATYAAAGMVLALLPTLVAPRNADDSLPFSEEAVRATTAPWTYASLCVFLAFCALAAATIGWFLARGFVDGQALAFPPSRGTANTVRAFAGGRAGSLAWWFGCATLVAGLLTTLLLTYEKGSAWIRRFAEPSLTMFATAAFLPIGFCVAVALGGAVLHEGPVLLRCWRAQQPLLWDAPSVSTGVLVGGSLVSLCSVLWRARQSLRAQLWPGNWNWPIRSFAIALFLALVACLVVEPYQALGWLTILLAVAVGLLACVQVNGETGLNPASPLSRSLLLIVGLAFGGPIGVFTALVLLELGTQVGAGLLTSLSAARWLRDEGSRRFLLWLHLGGALVGVGVVAMVMPYLSGLLFTNKGLPCITAQSFVTTTMMLQSARGEVDERAGADEVQEAGGEGAKAAQAAAQRKLRLRLTEFVVAALLGAAAAAIVLRFEGYGYVVTAVGIGGLLGLTSAVTLLCGAVAVAAASYLLSYLRITRGYRESLPGVVATGMMIGEALVTIVDQLLLTIPNPK